MAGTNGFDTLADVKFEPGTRLLCTNNGRTYQMGAKHGKDHFWMMCESPADKGLVSARTIMDCFVPAPEVVNG